MIERVKKIAVLNGNCIKILAAILMLIDHIGLIFFPKVLVWRYLGRISMPLFAFMIAEGCKYTKNKFRHFSLMFLLGVVCQIIYFIFDNGYLYMSILITFSLSIIMIYALQYAKKCLFSTEVKAFDKTLACVLFITSVFLTWLLNSITKINNYDFYIDYGFWGCILPVFVALLDFRGIPLPQKLKWLDWHILKLVPFTVGIILMCLFSESELCEWYSLISVPILLLYNGERGKYNLKYFFYVFYPAHLVVLYGIAVLIMLAA
jgi:hypothetical protein